MRKGLTTGQKRLILILGGFFILLGTLFFIFQKNTDKANELKRDTNTKQNEVAYLSELQIRVNEMKETTEKVQKETLKNTQKYPCKMTQQKAISNIYELSVASGVRLRAIRPTAEQTFIRDGKFMQLSEDGSSEATTESENTELSEVEKNPEKRVSVLKMVGKITSYEVELTGSRKQILKAFDWVSGNSEPMSVSAINLTFDKSTGKLTGTLALNFYSLNGNGRTYEEPDISGIILGNEDVFGTFK